MNPRYKQTTKYDIEKDTADSDIQRPYSLTGFGYINDKRKKMISLIMKEETRAPFNLFTVSPSLF